MAGQFLMLNLARRLYLISGYYPHEAISGTYEWLARTFMIWLLW
jgi:hypothetical protein